jgi:transposase
MAKTPSTNAPSDRGRFSAQRKTDAVLRLLRGEDLEALSRALGVTAATLSGWREDFLDGGKAALKSRPADGRDEQLRRLQAKVGELTMDNELLRLRCGEEVPGLPFALRRPRP